MRAGGAAPARSTQSRLRHVAADFWFELLVAVLALAGMLELVVGRDSPGAPTSRLWLSIPAVALLVLPLFARRRFPFAAPVAYWLVAAALTFVDGLLIPFVGSLGVVGLATAFVLGNLPDDRQAGIGLAIVLGSMVIVIDNIPGSQTASQYVFITLRFAAREREVLQLIARGYMYKEIAAGLHLR